MYDVSNVTRMSNENGDLPTSPLSKPRCRRFDVSDPRASPPEMRFHIYRIPAMGSESGLHSRGATKSMSWEVADSLVQEGAEHSMSAQGAVLRVICP
jgi:hypothetical protein